eukprot:980966-Pleurochrysis_carterae.AAC.1
MKLRRLGMSSWTRQHSDYVRRGLQFETFLCLFGLTQLLNQMLITSGDGCSQTRSTRSVAFRWGT